MEYQHIDVKEFLKAPEKYTRPDGVVWFAKNGKRKKCYLRLYCGFDIETYTMPDTHRAYMYVWQFSIYGEENYIITGRHWSDFVFLIDTLKKTLELSPERRLIILDFNFGFEFQYLKRWFKWSKIFAKETRQPLLAFIDDCIEFRDAQAITGGSLALLAKNYTETQKAKGDLDYTIPRTYLSELTPTEWGYCLSDVAILAEFSKYLFDTYIEPEKFIPLTKTGLLRREVKKGTAKNWDIKREIYRCYPDSFELYTQLMEWCFKGGYTHANLYHAGKVLDGVRGRDITSSYPYVMLAKKGFPVSPLKRENPADFEKLYIGEKHCLMFRAIFTGVKSRTNHSYESSYKCLALWGAIIDNGRVRSATTMDVWLTEIDFTMYQLFYKWDGMKIILLYSSIRGYLPKYLLMPMAEAYTAKCKMKRDGLDGSPEYANQKAMVNSAFGLTCQKLVTAEVKMSQLNYMWYLDKSEFDYERERKRAILLPQWGIYVCALARERICGAIWALGNDSLYSDTDSIKYLGNHEDYFGMVNTETQKTMKETCERLNLDYDLFYDLGSFEQEYGGREVRAKFLGAKRYIIEDQGKPKVTIAGLPKGALEQYCEEHQTDIFETFTHGMLLNCNVSCKNAHCYNDEPHEDIINGVPVAELSSVGIYPIDFTMKLSEFYLTLLGGFLTNEKQYEHRIY